MAVSFTAFADPEGTFTREVVVPRHLRVFLASPGDVHDERNQALAVLERLPYDPFLRGQVTLEVVAWDKPGAGAPMLVTMTPQEAIETGLPKPSECDIVIVIFWSRMGTASARGLGQTGGVSLPCWHRVARPGCSLPVRNGMGIRRCPPGRAGAWQAGGFSLPTDRETAVRSG